MTPEKLLEAMTDLEDNDIMTAKKQPPRRRTGTRKFVVLVAAVVALMAMTVTAFAAEEISGWFAKYFANNTEAQLSTEQLDYIEENEQHISQRQTCDGFTLELKSAITDGRIAYITIGVTAPEDVVLSKTTIEGYDPGAPVLSAENWGDDFLTDANNTFRLGGVSMSTMEDNDGLDNTQDMLIEAELYSAREEGDPFQGGMLWKLHIENLTAGYINEAYIEELCTDKYSGQTENFVFTDDEGMLAYPKVTLAEGVWDFDFTFVDSDTREIELIEEPVTTAARVGLTEDGSEVYQEVQITSLTLRSFSAQINCGRNYAVFSDNSDKQIYVVMEDGSQIPMYTTGSNSKGSLLVAETPIILDEVSHVLLADGTTIPMP